jgi:tetratricopeptide (TPR) repeat protein
VVGGRYELRSRLGSGGSASVYRAYDRHLSHEIALKLLHPASVSSTALARLRREASIARQLNHPHLARVFDVEAVDSHHFLTMELVPGGSLRDRLQSGPLPVADVLRWGGQLLEALGALHGEGIVHRDVKPGNILLTPEGELKVADLGLARRLEGEETRMTHHQGLLGTWDYLAPEQVAGRDGDARSDLYAVGLILFEMLAGRFPFARDRSRAAVMERLRGRAPGVQRFRRVTPRWLRRFVGRLLAADPEQRYADAGAALADFRRQSVPLGIRAWRRAAVMAAAATLLALVGWTAWRPDRGDFFRLAPDGETGIVALDASGRPLWRLPGLDPEIATRLALARVDPGATPLLAGVLRRPGDNSPERMRVLSFLDPASGRVVRTERLVSGASAFQGLPDRYHPEIVLARDLDGDGIDEILITYYLEGLAPSYTVLYEPSIRRSRVLFSGSGYHRIEEVADIDGDGRGEALFVGTNNAMGWYSTIVAVSIEPWIGEGPLYSGEHTWAVSPDLVLGGREPLWYALLPRGYTVSEPGRALGVDPASRRLVVRYQAAGREVSVGFDGFLAGGYARPLAERAAHRSEAYAHLREVQRLIAGGDGNEAFREAELGRARAELAEDDLLAEVLRRFAGKALARAGRLAEADRWFDDLARGSANASDVAFDAGRAFHTEGDLDRALTWYERGLGRGASFEAGKSKIAFLDGIVLVHLEQGQPERAQEAIRRFLAIYPPWQEMGRLYRELVGWRSGGVPDVSGLELPVTRLPDLTRYHLLELRNAGGEDPRSLLPEVRRLQAEAPLALGGLYALESEILIRLGRPADASAARARAIPWLEQHVRDDPALRLHLTIARERAAAAGES